jgi:hypothetical protein
MTLDEILDRLLHKRAFRIAFTEGRYEELAIGGVELEELRTVNVDQLASTANQIQRDLLRRKHRGSGGLIDLYRGSVEAWKQSHPSDGSLEELSSAFMESEPFDAWRELSPGAGGIALEEAFYLFLEQEGIGSPAIREQEFLTAMMKLLAVSPRADVKLSGRIRRIPSGFLALSSRGAPALYAAVRDSIVTGSVTPLVHELLASTDDPEDVARRHGAAPEALRAVIAHLRGLGLWEGRNGLSPALSAPEQFLDLPTT